MFMPPLRKKQDWRWSRGHLSLSWSSKCRVRTSLEARDMFTKLRAAGLTSVFGFQAIVNMGGITRALPMTGITLPFVSHGGFSLITSFAMLGMLMAFSHRTARDRRLAVAQPARSTSVVEAVR